MKCDSLTSKLRPNREMICSKRSALADFLQEETIRIVIDAVALPPNSFTHVGTIVVIEWLGVYNHFVEICGINHP